MGEMQAFKWGQVEIKKHDIDVMILMLRSGLNPVYVYKFTGLLAKSFRVPGTVRS